MSASEYRISLGGDENTKKVIEFDSGDDRTTR